MSVKLAGVITAVGEDVEGFNVGDKVLGVTRFGAYASHINMSPKLLRSFPSDWSFAEAAAYPVQVNTPSP